MDYLHAFGYARSQSVRPCYLRSDHDFYISFRRFPINSKKFWGMMSSRWPCHGLSRSVTAFSDNAQDLNIVFCLLSRSVTVCHATVRQFEANMNPCPLRLAHFDNARAICDHQKWLNHSPAFPICPYLFAWIFRDSYNHMKDERDTRRSHFGAYNLHLLLLNFKHPKY